MGGPNEDLKYFLDSKNKEATTKKEEQDEFFQGEKKTFRPPLFSNFIFSSYFACFEQFKKL
jgi:hypothetical protein